MCEFAKVYIDAWCTYICIVRHKGISQRLEHDQLITWCYIDIWTKHVKSKLLHFPSFHFSCFVSFSIISSTIRFGLSSSHSFSATSLKGFSSVHKGTLHVLRQTFPIISLLFLSFWLLSPFHSAHENDDGSMLDVNFDDADSLYLGTLVRSSRSKLGSLRCLHLLIDKHSSLFPYAPPA